MGKPRFAGGGWVYVLRIQWQRCGAWAMDPETNLRTASCHKVIRCRLIAIIRRIFAHWWSTCMPATSHHRGGGLENKRFLQSVIPSWQKRFLIFWTMTAHPRWQFCKPPFQLESFFFRSWEKWGLTASLRETFIHSRNHFTYFIRPGNSQGLSTVRVKYWLVAKAGVRICHKARARNYRRRQVW